MLWWGIWNMQTSSNRNKIREVNEQQRQERLRLLTSSNDDNSNPINDIIAHQDDAKKNEEEQREEKEDVNSNNENLSSVQERFGVRKLNRPVKDAQLTARIDSRTLKRFKEIVKTMYYPDKPNINETVSQIIRAFVEEYDKKKEE